METGIALRVIWFDEVEDMLEVIFACSNGSFAGRAEIYLSSETLKRFAKTLSGFPAHPEDVRDFEIGTFNPNHADGGARMRFYCADAAGHAMVDVRLRGDRSKGLGEIESVALRTPIQAAAVDDFVRQLRAIGKTIGATAILKQARS